MAFSVSLTASVPQPVHDVFDLDNLLLRALARFDARDVDDRLLGRVQYLHDLLRIGVGVEEVSNIKLLQVLVAVELLVVSVGNRLELRFVLRM